MPAIQTILREVLAEIVPHDSVLKEAQAFVKKINTVAKQKRIRATAVLGGSFAKDTNLNGDYDVDVFVKFNKKYPDEQLSEMLADILKPHKPDRIHGSRDYFQIKDNILFEIVPVREIKKPQEALNVTDFSPFHVAWVKKAQKSSDIRLAKKFCKAAGVYGAESYKQGFSGHVLDILTIHYGSFAKLLKAASNWKPKTVVDPKNYYKGRALQVMNQSKITGPLIVVDPTQADRNAAAAVSVETYAQFIAAAKKFLKTPSATFFEEQPPNPTALAKKGTVLTVHVQPLTGTENVVGAKLAKIKEFMTQSLKEFSIVDIKWVWKEGQQAVMYFVVKLDSLPSTVVHSGPPLDKPEHVAAFKKKYKKTWTAKGRIFAEVHRMHTTPTDALRAACSSSYVKERARKCTVA